MNKFDQKDWLFVLNLRRAEIVVDHEGRLKIRFAESPAYAAAELRRLYEPKEAHE